MRILGIAGPASAGKDSCANWFAKERGACITHFAKDLKAALDAMFGFSPADWNDRAWKERTVDWIGKSPREMAQTLGTQWGRELVHTDIWVRAAAHRIAAELGHVKGLIVIPDVRFENEATWVRQNGSLLHVRRPNTAEVGLAGHASEAGVAFGEFDYEVNNYGTFEDLYAQLARRFP